MSAEGAYRAAMRWYPTRWRRANEDVVVGTLLDVADAEGRTAPTRAERRDLRRAGMAARADVLLPGAVRDRVAAVSLGSGTTIALALFTGQAWAGWVEPDGAWAASAPELIAPDGVVWQMLIHPGLWVLAALAALVGRTVVTRILLVASIPLSVVSILPSDASFLLRPSLLSITMMGVLALLSCVGRPPRRWQLLVTGVGAVLIASWLTFLGPLARTYFPRGGVVDFLASPYPVAGLVIAIIVLIARHRRVEAAAVMVASAPWLVLLLADVFWLSFFSTGYVVKLVVIGAVAVAVPIAMLLVARRYARPPWLSPSESSDCPTSASPPSSTR